MDMLIEKRESNDVNQPEDNNELKIKELKKNELLKIGVAHKKIKHVLLSFPRTYTSSIQLVPCVHIVCTSSSVVVH